MDSTEFEPRRGSTKTIIIVAACAAVLCGVFLYLWLGGATPPPVKDGGSGSGEDPLKSARALLDKETDLSTCRSALSLVNVHFAQPQKAHPSSLNSADQERLKQRFDLSPSDQAEIASDAYTLLDGQYLDQCFLLRDAARSLEGDGRGPARKPLDRAAAAFAWVVREVRLQEGVFPVLPPQFALRRGWGTALDRALIFLSLLEQLGDPDAKNANRPRLCGCLLGWPGPGNGSLKLWACGVVIGDEPKMYLFDPRLGLPLPGPKGEGIATLAEARKDPTVLAQLTVDPKHEYDVTAKQAQEAELYQYCPLSALAPRLRFLQDEVLAPTVRVTLTVDAEAEEKKLATAAATDDKPAPVKVMPSGATLLRTFLPKEEGGTEGTIQVALAEIRGFVLPEANMQRQPMQQQRIYQIELAPWYYLWAEFRDQRIFPINVGLGQRVRSVFAEPFSKFVEPKAAHDSMLRGDYKAAIPMLTEERDLRKAQLDEFKNKVPMNQAQLTQQIRAWVAEAQKAAAEEERARGKGDAEALEAAHMNVESVWNNEGGKLIARLLYGAVARARDPETTYYVALCKHEMAEQAQQRLNASAKGATAARAEREWNDAVYWWNQLDKDEYKDVAEHEAARRLYGRALAMLGKPDEAVKVWQREGDPKHPLETVACLYLASRQK